MGTEVHLGSAEAEFLSEAELNSGTKPAHVTTLTVKGQITLDPGTGAVFSVTTAGVVTAASIQTSQITGLGALTISGAFTIDPGTGAKFTVTSAGAITQAGNLTLTGANAVVNASTGPLDIQSAKKIRLVAGPGYAARLPVASVNPTLDLQKGDLFFLDGLDRPRYFNGLAWRDLGFFGDLLGFSLTDSTADLTVAPANTRSLRINLPDSADATELTVRNQAAATLLRIRSGGRIDMGLATKGIRLPTGTADFVTTGLVAGDVGLMIFRSDLRTFRYWDGTQLRSLTAAIDVELGNVLTVSGASILNFQGPGVNIVDAGGGQVDVNISQLAETTNASATFKGVTLLSVNPVNAAQPIALGVNDPRVHSQNTDAGTSSNLFAIGDGTSVSDKIIEAAAGAANNPRIRWGQAAGVWELRDSGVTFFPVGFRDHNLNTNLQGGATTERFHLTSAQHSGLTGGGASTLHTHDHGTLVGLEDDDHTLYVKADGTRAFTGVVAGVTPTAAAHLSTKGYVDAQVLTATNAFGAPVQTLADLRAVPAAQRTDKQVRLVEDVGALYRFDAQATSGDEQPNDLPATGFWIRASGTLKVFEEATDLGPVTSLKFAGAEVTATVAASQATITISSQAPADASDTVNGLLSKQDKIKIDSIEAGAQVNPVVGTGLDLTGDTLSLNLRVQEEGVDVGGPINIVNFAGSVVTATRVGGTATVAITIPTATITVQEGDVTVSSASTLDFDAAAFNITEAPVGEANIAVNFGAAVGTVCQGNDARLSDARTPTAHAVAHQDAGADEINVAGLSGQLADAQKVRVENEAVLVGNVTAINFIGSGVSAVLSGTKANVTIAGGGGGGGTFNAWISPEFPGAVVEEIGNGGSSGFDAGFDGTNFENFYSWSTDQTGVQEGDVVMRVGLPSTFASLTSIEVLHHKSAAAVSAKMDVELYGTNNVLATTTGGANLQSMAFALATVTPTGGTFAAGGNITIKFRMSAGQNETQFLGRIRINITTS